MVDRDAFMAGLERARQKMLGENGEPVVTDWSRLLLYHFTDIDEYWTMEIVDGVPGEPVQQPDEVDEADIRVTMPAQTLLDLMDGTLSKAKALTSGKVKVKASMADMGKLRLLM